MKMPVPAGRARAAQPAQPHPFGLLALLWILVGALVLAWPAGSAPAGAAADRLDPDRPAQQATVSATPGQPTPTPTPTSIDGPGLCSVSGEQEAGTDRIPLGGYLGLSLTLRASCPQEARGRADILLVVDHSNSMKDEGKMEAARAAVRQFVDNVDFERHRVGLMPFNDGVYVAQPLTDNRDYLYLALAGSGEAEGGTNIAAAIRKADQELEAAGRRSAVHIIVLMTDGKSNPEPMREAARVARANGRVLFTIGLGGDAEQSELRAIADTPDHYYFAPGPDALAEIYLRIAEMIQAVNVTDIVLVDRLGQQIEFAPGSGRPREPEVLDGSRDLRWKIPYLDDSARRVAYEVTIDRAGTVRPSELAWADYTDGDGTRRRFTFEPPEVEVFVPERFYAHLPILYDRHCIPARRWSDVALVIDVSSSMAGGKLESAIASASTFVDRLNLPTDRAAVVVYDAQARVVQPLTGDRAALRSALAGLMPGQGTRLDRGLQAGIDALLDPTLRGNNRPVIILLSDGQQVEGAEAIEEAIQRAEHWDIQRYTIAFGADADRQTLLAVAGQPSRAFYAADAGALDEIYRSLATLVGCK